MLHEDDAQCLALQLVNWMSIEALLNPNVEHNVIDITVDKDIFHAVMESQDTEENGEHNSNINVSNSKLDTCLAL